MSKCEHKMVRKFAPETEKLMHSLYPTDKANKLDQNEQDQIMSKCEHKVVRKFALET